MDEVSLLKTLAELALENRFAAFGLGIIFALYLIGRFGGEPSDPEVTLADPDEAIAFYERRIEVLKQVREERKSSSEKDVLNALVYEVQALRTAMDEFKQEGQAEMS